ncbi:MAG: IS110 family transposase [Armatimonadota bacterium]|nr:IS110 family transposase [Armatimonadota bacterium]
MRTYIGVDYHRGYSYMTAMDETGNIRARGRVANDREEVREFVSRANCDGEAAAVLEASRNWMVMYDWLEELVGEVHLAHPLKVKAIAEARIKTDKIDSEVLAHLLRCDLLPEAHVPAEATRVARNILRQRMFFVRVRTMVKNRVRGLLDRYPELAKSQPCKDIFSKEDLLWLRGVSLRSEDQQMLDEELELYGALEQHVRRSDALVEKLAHGDERVKLLETIPGIGKFFGVLIAHEVDDVRRFSSEKKFFSYIGIVPSTHSSGGRTYHGRLTKQGNKYLRWAFVEAIWPAVRGDPSLAAYYARIKARAGPNPAKIATAGRLATVVYRVLSQGRPYYRSQVAGSRPPSCILGGLH